MPENNNLNEIINNINQREREGCRWVPIVGPQTRLLLERSALSDQEITVLLEESIIVLTNCVPPNVPGEGQTVLVVGYIQSGKTTSFTTVSALACDNGYRIIIILVGTKRFLSNQSLDELRNQLQIDDPCNRKWSSYNDPRVRNDFDQINNILTQIIDPDFPEDEKRTILITVLKQQHHISNLIQIVQRLELNNIPVIIIDDEADHASMNTMVASGNESTIYRLLRDLKDSIPHHSFLQYTATPQAPLLITYIDELSPSIGLTISPGSGYVGGREIFIDNRREIIRNIPINEIPTSNNPLQTAPPSLLRALALFFLGVSSGRTRGEHQEGENRTMIVHPSRLTIDHHQYFLWVVAIQREWHMILLEPDNPDRSDLLALFQAAYDDLEQTVDDLELFQDLCSQLRFAILTTRIVKVNSEPDATNAINFAGQYSQILVGGSILDRGLAIRGLSVTYMPRGVGGRQADSIQQRGRFFGYRRAYLGFCRIFLQNDIVQAYVDYVNHEESVRALIERNVREGLPLTQLRRAFLLDRSLVPTRRNVIGIPIDQIRTDRWIYQSSSHTSEEIVEANNRIIDQFFEDLNFVPDEGHSERTEFTRHGVAQAPLHRVFENLLMPFQIQDVSDEKNFAARLVVIKTFLESHPEAACTIFNMSNGILRSRTINSNSGKIETGNFFQGPAPDQASGRGAVGSIYPGDEQILSDDAITIQIHNISVRRRSESGGHDTILENVKVIALHIASHIAQDVVID